MKTLLDQINHRLRRGISETLSGNSRQDLLNSVTDTLMLFGDELVHAKGGRTHRIAIGIYDRLSLKSGEFNGDTDRARQRPLLRAARERDRHPLAHRLRHGGRLLSPGAAAPHNGGARGSGRWRPCGAAVD